MTEIPERDTEGVGYSEYPKRAAVAQVTAILAGPVLYLLALSLKYGAVNAACRADSTARLHVFAALFLVAVLLVAFVCHRAWQRHERGTPDRVMGEGAPDRRRVVVLLGLMLSAISALGVLLLWLPVFVLHPCRM